MRHVTMIIIMALLQCRLEAVSAPADPYWAIKRGAGEGEAQDTSLNERVIRDAYGYYAILRLNGVYNPGTDDWDAVPTDADDPTVGSVDLKMRYIPPHNKVLAPGIPDSRALHISGAPVQDPFARVGEGPCDPAAGNPRGAGYWMLDNEVTMSAWNKFEPSVQAGDYAGARWGDGDNVAVESVAYTGVVDWLAALNATLATHPSYVASREAMLPSEREWEYAARAGTSMPYSYGATITGIEWILELLDESTDPAHNYDSHTYDDGARTDNPKWFADILERSYGPPRTYTTDGAASEAEQESYLLSCLPETFWRSGISLRSTNQLDDDDNRIVNSVTVDVRVTIHVKDYFQIRPSQQGNFAGRYRLHYVGDQRGRYVPVLRRYRKITDHHYVEDQTCPDDQVYFRYAGADNNRLQDYGDLVPTQTHNDDFVRYDGNQNRITYDRNWFSSDDGPDYSYHEEHYRDAVNVNPNGDGLYLSNNALEVFNYIPIATRYRRISDGGINYRESDANFAEDEDGDWVRFAIGSYARYQRIGERYNQGWYDSAGTPVNRTIEEKEELLRTWSREEIQDEKLVGWRYYGAVAGYTVGPNFIDLNMTQRSSIDEDMLILAAALKELHTDRLVTTDGGEAARIMHYTIWDMNPVIHWDWSQLDAHRAAEDGAWDGYDVLPLDENQLRPNAWGLYNIHGNVAEWTTDGWDGVSTRDISLGDQQVDTSIPDPDLFRVVRGGSWRHGALSARLAARERRLAMPYTAAPGHIDDAISLPQQSGGALNMPELTHSNVARGSGASVRITTRRPGYDDVGFRFIIPE